MDYIEFKKVLNDYLKQEAILCLEMEKLILDLADFSGDFKVKVLNLQSNYSITDAVDIYGKFLSGEMYLLYKFVQFKNDYNTLSEKVSQFKKKYPKLTILYCKEKGFQSKAK